VKFIPNRVRPRGGMRSRREDKIKMGTQKKMGYQRAEWRQMTGNYKNGNEMWSSVRS